LVLEQSSCARTPQAQQVAPQSDALQPPHESKQHDAGPERWQHFAEMRDWPLIVANRLSRGHFAEPSLADVRASPESRDAYIGLVADRPMPDGAKLAIAHRDARTSIPGPVFVMEKRAGTWTYLVLGATGEITAQGELELCRRCHALAPADHLFGTGTDPGPDLGRGASPGPGPGG
jgi:hypothetical protein